MRKSTDDLKDFSKYGFSLGDVVKIKSKREKIGIVIGFEPNEVVIVSCGKHYEKWKKDYLELVKNDGELGKKLFECKSLLSRWAKTIGYFIKGG